jgi:PPK2 family polyphosphate:nucleotide phosphotransferase
MVAMMSGIEIDAFRVPEGQRIRLRDWPTKVKPLFSSKPQYRAALQKQVAELSRMQSMLYARRRHALLVIFQAMDAAGKDGAIKHVMSGVNPQGCRVHSFKQPSAEELNHDFLWRTSKRLPERGYIGIFNRSYYEEALIVRVHPELLRKQNLPEETVEGPSFWESRYQSMRDLEGHLHRNGTRVVKIFLHLSNEEQQKRFLSRIDEPDKNWKMSLGDVEERKLWDEYQKAYEACLSATSTESAPWFAVPADHKQNARLIVAGIIVATLKSLHLSYPSPSPQQLSELRAIRKSLARPIRKPRL